MEECPEGPRPPGSGPPMRPANRSDNKGEFQCTVVHCMS